MSRQRETPSGPNCAASDGDHGGAPGLTFEDAKAVAKAAAASKGDGTAAEASGRPDVSPPPGDRRTALERAPVFVAREGDNLHVRFPEVTLPLRAKYAMAKVGGLSMTRVLRAGDDAAAEGRAIAAMLRSLSLEIARETIADFDAELEAARRGSR